MSAWALQRICSGGASSVCSAKSLRRSVSRMQLRVEWHRFRSSSHMAPRAAVVWHMGPRSPQPTTSPPALSSSMRGKRIRCTWKRRSTRVSSASQRFGCFRTSSAKVRRTPNRTDWFASFGMAPSVWNLLSFARRSAASAAASHHVPSTLPTRCWKKLKNSPAVVDFSGSLSSSLVRSKPNTSSAGSSFPLSSLNSVVAPSKTISRNVSETCSRSRCTGESTSSRTSICRGNASHIAPHVSRSA
mmetsp:Transcript_27936/g.38269  ORF Transcript_27936/g.38269 Transcript_27936/m.38269 type:complete len:244 (+) Transcript_27936:3375-4106(+)